MSKKIAAAFAAALALALFAPAAQAQKALVYCPVGVDATGCDRIVAALQPKFPDGVDRGYDGTNSTVDLMKVDLEHYAVIVVPSLADDDTKQPYSVLRKAAARLHLAVNGRVAVYSGAPDQGSANRSDKDAIIQNLATWSAKGHTRATSLVGLVAFLDLSENTSARYSWVKSVSLADVSADAETQSIADLTPAGRGGDLLANAGRAIRFSNMASYGLNIGARAAARTEVGAMSTATDSHQSVLVTYANADGKDLGSTGGRPGGAAFDVSGGGGGSGPTLTTDKPDYLPGDTVLFSGTGWAPNDTVTITIHEDPQWSNPDRTVTAVVDGNGNLSSHDFVVQPRDFGVTFTATAVGNPSGLVAQTTFTDGNATSVSGTVTDASNNSPLAGVLVSCTTTSGCNANLSTNTDASGHYVFDNSTVKLAFGTNGPVTLTLTFSKAGYATGSLTLSNVNNTDVLANKNIALTPAGPTKLAFPNAAVTGVVNQCLTIDIQTQNAVGTPTAVTSNTTVNLTTDNGSTGAGAFYTSNACTTTTTTIQINSGSSSGTLFYEATARGNGTHTVTVAATGLTQASQGETINKANQTALTITAPAAGIFGDRLTITTTGGSGTGALSFSAGASTACSIITTPGPDLNKLQITSGTGSCSITATKETDNDFNSVTSAPQTVTVSKATPAFSNLSSQTITFGTATTTFTGKLASGALIPTGNVSITLGTTPPVTQSAAIAADGTFSSTFNTTTVPASATPYAMTYSFATDNNFAAANDATTTLTVNKANQTITFAPLANKTFGDPDFSVSATASSGLAVTFTVGATDQCTITGALVHLTGAGSCTVKADQAGNGNYNAAPQMPQTFSIGKATPLVVATGGTFPYDGLPKAGTGTATGVGGANLTPVTLSYSGTGATTYGPTATAPTNAGTYTVTATFAGDANYLNTSSSPAALTISPKALTIKANDRVKTYGDAVVFAGTEFTPTGLVSGETIGSVTLTSPGAAATATVAGSPYAITASAPTGGTFLAANYTISFQPGALTVNTKALTITANDRTKTYGDVVTFAGTEFTAPGLINGDAVTSVTLTSLGAAANAGVAGSPYTITPSAAVGTGLGNYAIAYAAGHLTVNPKALTITANNRVKTYGDVVTFAGTEFQPVGIVNSETIGGVTLTSAGAAGTATVAGSPYPIVPSAATGGTFDPGNYTITYCNGSLTVNPKPLTITANDRTKTYGDAVIFAGTEFTAPGLINGDVVNSVTLTSAGAAANAGVIGSPYAITPSAAVGTGLGNYAITYAVGHLTINPKALTITANNRVKTYGDVVTFAGTEFTPNGLVLAETVGSVTLASAGALATAAVSGSPYTITASAATGGTFTAGNYAITYAPGALTVKPKPLTVKADDKSRVYGAPNPALTYTITGFVNGENSSVVSGAATTSTTANGSSTVAGSTYPISISKGTLAAGNYTFEIADGATFTSGNLSVTPASTTVSSTNQSLNEGVTSISLSATVSAVSPSTATVGEGSVTFLVTGPGGFSQTVVAAVSGGSASTSYSQGSPIPPGNYSASVTYADPPIANFTGSNTSASIGISNVPPTITGVNYSALPVQINTPTTISGTFTDPGLGDGAYTLTINLSVLGTFSCSTTAPSSGCNITAPTSGGPGTFTLTKSFSTASVNVVTVTVADAFGGSDTKKQDAYLVLYDPNGGFVTGGGWINSPAGAYVADGSLAGKATFGFVSKYKKGQSVPDGNTEFQFHAAGMNFASTAYEWLVLAGARAQYKGTGTINGAGNYGFILTAIDGSVNGGGGTDRFRIKIWDNNNAGAIVYDNQISTTDDASLTTVGTLLGGGSIQIHN
jgi:hypothetical protein